MRPLRPAASDNTHLHVMGAIIVLLGWCWVLRGFYLRHIADVTMVIILFVVFAVYTALAARYRSAIKQLPDMQLLRRQFIGAFVGYAIAVLSVILVAWLRPPAL
jgi:hypothetical protein